MNNLTDIMSSCFSPKALRLAWERMIRSNGRDTKDYFGIELYDVNLEKNLARLSETLLSNQFKPTRPFKYYEPKQSGTHRTKTVLTVDDALVYQAIGNFIGQKCYHVLAQNSNAVFGCVLHPEVELGVGLFEKDGPEFYFYKFYPPLHNKFTLLRKEVIQKDSIHYKLETDIVSFFDSIPHSKLLITLFKQFHIDSEIVDLLSQCLNAWSGTRDSIIPGVGIPQGPSTSYLLANLFLHDLDNLLINQYQYSYFRYIDDIRIYDENKNRLTHALILIDNFFKARGLSINTEKTSVKEIENKSNEKIDELLVSQIDILNIDIINSINSDLLEEVNNFTENEVLHIENGVISDTKSKDIYKAILKQVEITLSTEFSILSNNNFNQLQQRVTEKSLQRLWTHNAYQWRALNQTLQTLSVEPNDRMIDIWLFGLENFYWKANHFCWNLNLYGANGKIKSRLLEMLNTRFKYYEWVRYQIISCLALSQSFDSSELDGIINNSISQESSELVRIGFYKLLLKYCEPQTELWADVIKLITNEKSFYIRNVAAQAISAKNGSQLINIKSWFGL